MDESLLLRLSGCSPSTPSPPWQDEFPRVPLLGTPTTTQSFTKTSGISQTSSSAILGDVVAFVDVRTESDNQSLAVGRELEQLGATVVDKFSDDVTHFIYKDGKKRALDMALRRKVHLVSVLWVESCKQRQEKVPEAEFYVVLPKKQTPICPVKFKRYKSMQPKGFEEEIVMSEEKVKRREERKEKTDRFRLYHQQTPDSCRKKKFFVANTCRRTPEPDELISPMLICIPDTPPSMRRRLATIQSATPVARIQSPTSQASLRPIQRKFTFDDKGSPSDVITVSSDSLKSSISSQEVDFHGNRAAAADVQGKADGKTLNTAGALSSSACNESMSVKCTPKETDSISPEIELLSTKAKLDFQGSQSYSQEAASGFCAQDKDKSMKMEQKSFSEKEEEVKRTAKKDLPGPAFVTRNISVRMSDRLKRRCSPSLDEETDFRPKRFRADDGQEAGGFGNSSKPMTVSLIPLSQHTPSRVLQHSRQRANGNEEVFGESSCTSENLDTSGYTIRRVVLGKSERVSSNSLKNFISSSPTSSQEASRNCSPLVSKVGALNLSNRVVEPFSTDKPKNHSITTGTEDADGCLATFMTGADSTPTENRVGKRRSLNPFLAAVRQNTTLRSRRKTLHGSTGEADVSNDSTPRKISSTPDEVQLSTVVLRRLPGAWQGIESTDSTDALKSLVEMSPNNGNESKASPRRQENASGENSIRISDDFSALGQQNGRKKPVKNDGKKSNVRKKIILSARSASSSSSSSVNTALSSSSSSVKARTASIAITSLHRGEQKMASEAIKQLGCYELNENVDDLTTHVVSGGNRRTVKVLKGISKGLWIVSLDWIVESSREGKWLAEEPYEMTKYFPACRTSRLEKAEYGPFHKRDLFSDLGYIFVAEGAAPPKEDLEQLVTMCCGKITQQLRTAKICVGKSLRHSIVNVSEQWILDSITQLKCLPFEKYFLNT